MPVAEELLGLAAVRWRWCVSVLSEQPPCWRRLGSLSGRALQGSKIYLVAVNDGVRPAADRVGVPPQSLVSVPCSPANTERWVFLSRRCG